MTEPVRSIAGADRVEPAVATHAGTPPVRSWTAEDERWFVCRTRRSAPRLRLFCLPYAGGNGGSYRAWGPLLPEDVELWPIELPGRWSRMREPPFRSLAPLVEALGSKIAACVDLPYALFGYSFGALVAFELVRWMRRRGLALPMRLFCAAAPAPQLPRLLAPLHTAEDERLIDEVAMRYAPLPASVLADPELRALLLGTLRADLACIETYRYDGEEKLDVPIEVYGGALDRSVPRAALDAWGEQSSSNVEVQLFPGGHFFLHSSAGDLVARIASALASPAHPLLARSP